MEPSTSVAMARLELALEDHRRRLDELDTVANRLLAEQRAQRARLADAVARLERANGHGPAGGPYAAFVRDAPADR